MVTSNKEKLKKYPLESSTAGIVSVKDYTITYPRTRSWGQDRGFNVKEIK